MAGPDIYTSRLHLKQALMALDGVPMTALPPDAKAVIDPSLTISGNGWGGLVECDDGLICPVRGCGKAFHDLSKHIRWSHQSIGGTPGFRKLMGIPSTAPLMSESHREKLRSRFRMLVDEGRIKPPRQPKGCITRAVSKRARKTRSANARTPGNRNMTNDCLEQTRKKITLLHAKLGREPIEREFEAEYGARAARAVHEHFVTWNNALGQCGIGTRKAHGRISFEAVLDALRAWVAENGDLPTAGELARRSKRPEMPGYDAICAAFQTKSWRYAMQQAAALLNIYGGRYGLPERKSA